MDTLPEILSSLGIILFWGALIWGIAKLCSSSSKPKPKKRRSKQQNRKKTIKQKPKQNSNPVQEEFTRKNGKSKKPKLTALKRAVLMKEILDPPRAVRPYRYRWPR